MNGQFSQGSILFLCAWQHHSLLGTPNTRQAKHALNLLNKFLKFKDKTGSVVRTLHHPDITAVAAHDAVYRGKTQAHPVPFILGGEKGFKNMGQHFRTDSSARIFNMDADLLSVRTKPVFG